MVNYGLRDYYTIPEDTVFEFVEGAPTIKEVQIYVSSNMTFTTSSIVWVTGSSEPDDNNWYVTGLALAASSSNGFWGDIEGNNSVFTLAYDHNDGN